jgi:hypothetical protein
MATKQMNKPSKAKKRSFETQSQALESMRLIAAPNPKDDLSNEELGRIIKDPLQSPELIRHLIEFLKTL